MLVFKRIGRETMLYSLNFIKPPNRRERRMFYAKDDTEAMTVLRNFADRAALFEEELWLEKHPHGFLFQREKLGPRYWPPEEPKKCGKNPIK